MITFIEKSTYESSYGWGSTGDFTPVFMLKDGKEYFVHNLVRQTSGESGLWRQYQNERNVEIDKNLREQLSTNEGKFLTFYSRNENPIDFLYWIKENDFTLEIMGELMTPASSDGAEQFTDFHGNVVEYSAAFHYRIYDSDLLNQIKDIANVCKQHISWERH